MRQTAIYVRVSSRKQDTRSQEPDLNRWIDAYADALATTWYRDKATGRTMDRPGWNRLEAAIDAGKVSTVVVWRLDRLGRTASGLTALFEKLTARKVNLVLCQLSIYGLKPEAQAKELVSRPSLALQASMVVTRSLRIDTALAHSG
jgi:DNA invertase Pin-like site-specific DNA recombinase